MTRLECLDNHYSECPDGVLVDWAQSGEQVAFETLVQRYSKPLLVYISHYIGDYEQAEDILQHVLLKLYFSLPQIQRDKQLKPWLFQVARNSCVDYLRRQRPVVFSALEKGLYTEQVSPLEVMPDPAPLPEEVMEYEDLIEQVLRAIATLPPKFQPVMLLRSLNQLTFREIGQILGMPVPTARTYFHRAKPKLLASLSEL